ncbi:MAG: TonB-dependent receptor, partial [Bryobacteraceae bacterium]
GDPYSPEHFVTQQAMLADTYVLNPTMIFDIRAGFIRWDYDRIPGTLGLDPTTLGFPSYYSQVPLANGLSPSTTIPQFSITSPTYNAISTGLLYGRDDTYTLSPTFTWIKGHHTWKFGAEIHKNELNYFQNNAPGGVYNFDNLITSQNALNSGSTGSGLASFLLGVPNNSSLLQTSSFTYTTLYYQGYFVTDTWQATKKLTLTLGARWEIPGVYRERYNRQATFNFTEPNPALSGVLVNGQPVRGAFDLVATPNHPEEGLNPEKYHWITPRVGIAYRVSDRTVVRTGGGMFLSPATIVFQQGPNSSPVNLFQNPVVGSSDNFVTYSSTLSNPLPNGIVAPPGRDPRYQQNFLGTSQGGRASPYQANNSYTYQWNFTIQHQLPGDIALEAGYAGLRGIHLGLGRQYNQINPQYFALENSLRDQVPNPFLGRVSYGALSLPTVQRGQLLSPYPQYLSVSAPADFSGDSSYHSLQVKAEKRFKSGGTLLGSYTFSKILSNSETLTGWLDSPTGVAGIQNWYDLRAEKALSSFDTHQRLVISYVYDLPFGKGRMFLSSASGMTDKLVSGWGINGLTTFQRGLPLGFTATPNTTGFNTGLRPNVAPNCNLTVSGAAQSRLNGWFNTSCFSLPAPFTFGNESRTDPVLRGPGIANYDFAIFKRTPITERFNLEFRAEAFNLFNRVQFGQPNVVYTTAANSTFGQISTQLNQPRLMQMALRLRF